MSYRFRSATAAFSRATSASHCVPAHACDSIVVILSNNTYSCGRCREACHERCMGVRGMKARQDKAWGACSARLCDCQCEAHSAFKDPANSNIYLWECNSTPTFFGVPEAAIARAHQRGVQGMRDERLAPRKTRQCVAINLWVRYSVGYNIPLQCTSSVMQVFFLLPAQGGMWCV